MAQINRYGESAPYGAQPTQGTAYYDSSGDLRHRPATAMQRAVAAQKAAVAAGRAPSRGDIASSQLKQWYAGEAARKAATGDKVKSITASTDAASKAAIDALKAKNAAASAAATAALKKPVASAGSFNAGSVKPLRAVTGVDPSIGLAGGNAATAQFYIPPESTVSQFNVTGATGGGGLGTRQKASAGNVQSTPDKLGGKGKDQL